MSEFLITTQLSSARAVIIIIFVEATAQLVHARVSALAGVNGLAAAERESKNHNG